MSEGPYIPAATAAKLNGEHPKGTRHKAAMDMAIPLVGNGLAPEAVFLTLRSKFDADVTDRELQDVVRWAVDRRPTPSGFGEKPASGSSWKKYEPKPEKPKPLRSPIEQINWWMPHQEVSVERMIELSPFKIPSTPTDMAETMMSLLYKETDSLNIVCDYISDDGKKANPRGSGKTLTIKEWKEWIAKSGVPQSNAGAWVRPNPCASVGSGKGGAVTDDDITDHRFILLESDVLPLPIQLALYINLRLPIAMVLLSGGMSAHAWLRVDAFVYDQYKATADRVLALLAPFGIDQANKNPSRLSRLPGAVRKIGAANGGLQRLLWINDKCEALTEEMLKRLETSLQFPVVEDSPFQKTIINASVRYDELVANRGKLGVQTGIDEFDRRTGGLKRKQMTVIAAETNGGKSTVALNIINTALNNQVGVLLFTLEMDRDEVCDMLVSMNCRVSRNSFNTGDFSAQDAERIVVGSSRMKAFPLWIEDAATMTVEQIEARTNQLATEKKIGLVVIDYLQIVSPADERDTREQQIAKISRSLRAICKGSNLPFIILSQLNDEGKLRESRVIAHESHNVLLLEQKDDAMKIRVVKGRGIPKGEYVVRYEPEFCSISPMRKISDDDVPGER